MPAYWADATDPVARPPATKAMAMIPPSIVLLVIKGNLKN